MNSTAILHSGMFSHHSLRLNHFTDDGRRALTAAAEERYSNPNFAKLDVIMYKYSIARPVHAMNQINSPTEVSIIIIEVM